MPHTPGPWWVGTDEDAHVIYAVENGSAVVIGDASREDGDDVAEVCNANMMAAAPDLLAACKEALAFIRDLEPELLDGRDDVPESLRDAIAKAETTKGPKS